MNDQNIYDNKDFLEDYLKLRENPSAANDIVEKPALFSLCPVFSGKFVLDLGCGYGENCKEFSRLGAEKVIGIDISQKMLDIAIGENTYENVSFKRMSMSDLSALTEKFDVVLR
jgi:2-polyprenyl-3-methyl-5-hydroxy-6-metoxy-1,4-benzoquinol methylase